MAFPLFCRLSILLFHGQNIPIINKGIKNTREIADKVIISAESKGNKMNLKGSSSSKHKLCFTIMGKHRGIEK